jgi:hypothetical protein
MEARDPSPASSDASSSRSRRGRPATSTKPALGRSYVCPGCQTEDPTNVRYYSRLDLVRAHLVNVHYLLPDSPWLPGEDGHLCVARTRAATLHEVTLERGKVEDARLRDRERYATTQSRSYATTSPVLRGRRANRISSIGKVLRPTPKAATPGAGKPKSEEIAAAEGRVPREEDEQISGGVEGAAAGGLVAASLEKGTVTLEAGAEVPAADAAAAAGAGGVEGQNVMVAGEGAGGPAVVNTEGGAGVPGAGAILESVAGARGGMGETNAYAGVASRGASEACGSKDGGGVDTAVGEAVGEGSGLAQGGGGVTVGSSQSLSALVESDGEGSLAGVSATLLEEMGGAPWAPLCRRWRGTTGNPQRACLTRVQTSPYWKQRC